MSTAATLILNVDDNEGARYVKSRILSHAGFAVIEASTGYDALQAVREREPALVLLDVRLPDISGIEVCKLIKQDAATSSTLVLQTSAAAVQSHDKILALDGGADSYLTEPVDAAELVANVRALLRLHAAEKALREADRRKNRFLATLAHELRNPLAPLRNAIELLNPKYGATEAMRADARLIASRQLAHLGRLVDDLLDVSRISYGKIVLQIAALDLKAVVETAIETSKPLLDSKGHTLLVTMPTTACPVVGDGIRIAQIIGNLLSNAAKYTPDGGRIELRLDIGDTDVAVCVQDNGIGISSEELPSVFDPFMQSSKSMEQAGGGLGIGLALVRELAELHGGSATAYSDGPGRGSSFVIRLPLANVAQRECADKASRESAACAAANQRRVLIADDNTDAAMSLQVLLELSGHIVRVAHDGVSAIEMAQTFEPQVAILDIGLPHANGYQVAKALRAQPRTARALLIALTGYGQQSDKRAASDAGFNLHLVKPARLDELLREIERAEVT
ncbi:ATP-binding response regulator [Mycetohabitans endofungorum]|uniref:ATP-binding response regulator n=1 Tax=Mycetohabitans endofungorum TaxID=417203 RepID=UPI002B057755|nr:response regulator [Mycetohabitans endofungorum]